MFGGSWGTPQQPQQQNQQQGTSAFGQQQPNAFGGGGQTGFGGGGTGGFVQQQPQQPQVNPMFGAAAAAGTGTTPSTGFGAFGGGGTSAFGAKPATGFGAFGGGGTTTSAFGSNTGAFGQPSGSGTGAFGQPATGSAFGGIGGGGTGGFGAAKPATTTGGFGSNSTGANQNPEANVPPVATGSSNPPYVVYTEKDTSGPGGGNVTLNFQSISTMPAYRGTSFEEIRCQDYQQGRKAASASAFGQQTSAFGMAPSTSTSAFGQQPASTGGFGGFGQTQQQNTTQPPTGFGGFGQTNTTTTSAFGSTPAAPSAFGAFGQNNQQQQQQQQPQQTTSAFGAFGQNNQQQQQQQQPQPSAFGAFGQNNNAPKPFSAFGGGGGTTATTGTGAFGSGGFGQSTQPTTSAFGQTQNQGTTGGFGAFGQPKPSAFTPQPSTGGFGGFGQNQQPAVPQASTGLFGNTNNATATPGTGLFGQTTNTQPSTGLFGNTQTQPASTGLFGGGTGTTGLFGNNNNQPKPAPVFGSTGAFGQTNQQATTGAQPSTGLFGQPLNQQNTATTTGTGAFGGGTLFGAKPATTSLFGQSTAQPATTGFGISLFGGGSTLGNNTGTGLFGQSTANNAPQNPATMTASIAQPVQQNLPIFSLLQSTNQPPVIDSQPKRMTSYFVDVPSRSTLTLSSSKFGNSNKLRGFASSTAGLSRNGTGLSSTITMTVPGNGLKGSTATRNGNGTSNLLGPDAFLGKSASLGSENKPSPKKLVLDKRMDPNEVFGRAAAKNGSLGGGPKVSFNPTMSAAARDKELFTVPSPAPTPAPAEKVSSTKKTSSGAGEDEANKEIQEGDYYIKPSLSVLRSLSNRELSSFEGLVVGRKGFGEIQFLEPVDLTALPRLSALLGRIVQIENKEAIIYPDDGNDAKPPPGEGLNVKARIILDGCFAIDKATGSPIRDENHPSFIKNVKKLKNMKRTQFDSYDNKTGRWAFIAERF